MKIKSLLNLSESTVVLTVSDLENLLLKDFLKDNNISFKILKEKGTGGFPDVEFSGTKKSLKKMIHDFFGDDDLNDLIKEDNYNEALDPEEKVIRTYKKGNDKAVMKKQEDNSILIVYTLARPSAGSGLKFEFRNANEATKYLESQGWELDELHEAK